MTIYVLRYNNLLKIGYSSDFASRVQSIIASIPGEVSFVGHMPGEVDVEQHLHGRFSSDRFSGEWFVDSDRIRAFCDLTLDPIMPAQPDRRATALRGRKQWPYWTLAIRDMARELWPETSHNKRMQKITAALGWGRARVKHLYYAETVSGPSAADVDEMRNVFGASFERAYAASRHRALAETDAGSDAYATGSRSNPMAEG